MTTMVQAPPTQVYQVFIRATPEQIWEAITTPEFTARYFHGARITVADGRYRALAGPRLAIPLRRRDGRRAGQPRHVGDRAG